MYASNHKELIGQKYGDLTVTYGQPSHGGMMFWDCECVCGNHRRVEERRLKSGEIDKCVGCDVNLKMQRLAK